MTLQQSSTIAIVLSLCAVLAGCGSPLVQVALARATGPSATVAAQPAAGSPQIAMTLVSRGIKFPVQLLKTDGNIQLWTAVDGSQVVLKDGILTSTRGFGMDLMSAEVPSMAELLGGSDGHSRTHHYLDGTDSPIRRNYACSVEALPTDKELPSTTHIQEKCQSEIGKISNDFWISGRKRIVKSRQWVSTGVGYAIFDTAGL